MSKNIQFRDQAGYLVVLDVDDVDVAQRAVDVHNESSLLFVVFKSGSETFIEMESDDDLREVLKVIGSLKGVKTLVSGSLEDQVLSVAITEGKIPAIKKYREMSGSSLSEAKSYVEEMVPRRGGKFAF